MSFIHLMWSSYGHGFSQQLRRVRKRRGISQQALAEISGVSRSQISNLERNENGVHAMADPQLSTVYKLALALEIPPAVLLPRMSRPSHKAMWISVGLPLRGMGPRPSASRITT